MSALFTSRGVARQTLTMPSVGNMVMQRHQTRNKIRLKQIPRTRLINQPLSIGGHSDLAANLAKSPELIEEAQGCGFVSHDKGFDLSLYVLLWV